MPQYTPGRPKRQDQSTGEEEKEEYRNLRHRPRPDRAGQVRKEGKDRHGRKSHHTIPEFQTCQANSLKNGKQGRFLWHVLQRHAVKEAEEHHSWHVVPRQRCEWVARNKNLKEAWRTLAAASATKLVEDA
jgi:hypothetical protein